MSEQTRIATRCPACNSSTLFIANGNWLTCSLIGCPDPTLINSAGERLKAYWDDKQKAEKQNEQLREQNRVLRLAIEEYAMAKTDFDEKRLQEDHHAWRERYTRLVGAETILIALTATSQEGQHG